MATDATALLVRWMVLCVKMGDFLSFLMFMIYDRS